MLAAFFLISCSGTITMRYRSYAEDLNDEFIHYVDEDGKMHGLLEELLVERGQSPCPQSLRK